MPRGTVRTHNTYTARHPHPTQRTTITHTDTVTVSVTVSVTSKAVTEHTDVPTVSPGCTSCTSTGTSTINRIDIRTDAATDSNTYSVSHLINNSVRRMLGKEFDAGEARPCGGAWVPFHGVPSASRTPHSRRLMFKTINLCTWFRCAWR